ncbi:MAG: hypothetical protein FJ189_11840, partial [Gammaproteobacteria bacterium]|nr:hypothetical protein [Gammaproteobacteria bacterium]
MRRRAPVEKCAPFASKLGPQGAKGRHDEFERDRNGCPLQVSSAECRPAGVWCSRLAAEWREAADGHWNGNTRRRGPDRVAPVPEGDTVHKLAAALAPLWVGQAPVRVELKTGDGAQLCGRRIRSVAALGKHLFVEFDHGLQLRTHLGLYGSWHRYALDEVWRKPKRLASAVLEIGGAVYICFNAKACEIIRTDGVRERALRTRLSLDLVALDIDLSAIPRRARDFVEADAVISDVLLDQRIACGIGNVYKSEVLFLHQVHPLAPLEALSDAQLLQLYRTAAVL